MTDVAGVVGAAGVDQEPPEPLSWVAEQLWVLVVAGIPFGVVVAGLGSRLAMLVLRLTSDDRVRGVESDDGFVIGRFTLGGTYNLLLLGAVVGVIGAAAYRIVEPWLLGPTRLRRVTLGLGSAAVVGSMLVHDDGIDFHALTPTWLAIGLFVALPALFGLGIGPAVDAAVRYERRTAPSRRRWLLPVVLVACFPVVLFPLMLLTAGLLAWALVRDGEGVQRVRRSAPYGLVVRAAWLLIAAVGLFALVADVREIV